jgi:uncharacterized protein YjbJ (UPF0337 family)
MMRKRILIVFVAAVGLSAPALAQISKPEGQTISGQRAPATESRALVTWDKIAGNWKRFKGKVRKQWGKLTSDDVAVAQGRREELVGKIQARYGIDKDQADKQVEAWLQQQK